MLGVILAIPTTALSVWLLIVTARRLRRLRVSFFCGIGAAGLAVFAGYVGWLAANFELQLSPTFKWIGVPFPIGFFVLEGNNWTDFVPPHPVQWIHVVANVSIWLAIFLLPVRVWTWLIERRRHNAAQDTPAALLS